MPARELTSDRHWTGGASQYIRFRLNQTLFLGHNDRILNDYEDTTQELLIGQLSSTCNAIEWFSLILDLVLFQFDD